ncbi:GFA family protein [Rhizobium etli]|uniref:GFA family protein n=1 Tax=Rhizobium etli TaxID=29449 RepID=UPI0003839CC2|nr:GFA family protein [Rhizobium etli]AGS22165.1 GFA family glutathione-dependent formaldehyde-activating protein [Rhizobium etli bv. mimosae str. Mim1]
MSEQHTGGCLCGAVRFSIRAKPGPVVGCHCSQCRRQTGLYYAAVNVPRVALSVEDPGSVRWYRSSGEAQRGFCANCGSALFWQGDDSPEVSVLAGAFDEPSGLAFSHHIYCIDKGDFYDITDGLPQYDRYPPR